MADLLHLYYPWGFIFQILAIVHFYRRRPEYYWFWIILMGGVLGAAAYFVVEVLPDAALLREVFQGFGRRSRIRALEAVILDNPSAGNYEELGELCWDQKQYAQAREAFDRAIAARADSPHAFYRRALCALALGDLPAAIPDLEHAVRSDFKLDYYRAAGLLADTYARTGRPDQAATLFAEVTRHSTTPETLYNYACFLQSTGRHAESREWTEKLLHKQRTLPRYMRRIERPWFRKGKSLLKELASA